MLFSKACEYSIKACIYVAFNNMDDKKVGAKEISEMIQAPAPFTAKILKQLVQSGILSSTKGPKGGFFATEKQAEMTLFQIIQLIDGDSVLTRCALGLSECSESHPCPIHLQYGSIRDDLGRVMRKNTIKSMAQSYGTGKSFLKGLTEDID